MFKSKFFTVVIVLTFLAAAATVVFQFLEMKDYQLIETMLEKTK